MGGILAILAPRGRVLLPKGGPRALFGGTCRDVAVNEDSVKYLRKGTVDGKPVQMLIDTGCDRTIVSADMVRREKMSSASKVPVLCVHGDTCFYPTAEVELCSGSWRKWAKVAVAPNLPVSVLLGHDLYREEENGSGPSQGLMVVTCSKARSGAVTSDSMEATSSDVEEISGDVSGRSDR